MPDKELIPTPTQEELDEMKVAAVSTGPMLDQPQPEEKATIDIHPEPSPTQAENDLAALKACGPPPSSYLERPPIVVDVPYVDGSGIVGGMLTCTMGNWTGEPKSYTYSWKSNDKVVGSDPTYTTKSNEVGTSMTCTVTATNDFGSTVAPPSNAIVITEATTRAKK